MAYKYYQKRINNYNKDRQKPKQMSAYEAAEYWLSVEEHSMEYWLNIVKDYEDRKAKENKLITDLTEDLKNLKENFG